MTPESWTPEGCRIGFQPFVKLPSCEGHLYSAAEEFLGQVEALKREHLARREKRELVQTDTPLRPITLFHAASRYGGDLHRADMRPSKKKGSERLPSGCKSKAAGIRWLAELLGIIPNECTNYQQ